MKQDDDLRLALKQFKALADITKDYAGITSSNAELIYLNPAGRKMLGLGLDEDLAGISPARWATDEFVALCREYGSQHRLEGETWEADVKLRHQDGSIIPLSMASIGIKSEDGSPLFIGGIGRDMRASLAMEEELRLSHQGLTQALDQERELGELKSRFVSMVSHEFRTPLGVIMSAVEIMRHFDEKLSGPRRQELCNEIHDATRGMADLMEQVLMLGRVDAGKLGFRPMPLNLEVLAGKLIDESRSATHAKCAIHLECEPGVKDARGDEALLRHILGNLITNAAKYSPEGGDVFLRIRREGVDSVFIIEDHGIGIPQEELGKLFEAFSRCSNVGDIPGTGLGLVIVKRCTELHSGRIEVQSDFGGGTRFIVWLPMFDQPTLTTHHTA